MSFEQARGSPADQAFADERAWYRVAFARLPHSFISHRVRNGGISHDGISVANSVGVLLGFSGVALLLIQGGAQHLPVWPCFVILIAGLAWSLGAVLSTRLTLPQSRPLTAGAEMLVGGAVLLSLSAMKGDFSPFPHITASAALALSYLIVFGSVIAYTAYVWLLGRLPATRVASHAYVNPLVAVTLGYLMAGEVMTVQMLAGAAVVVASVFLILSSRVGRETPTVTVGPVSVC